MEPVTFLLTAYNQPQFVATSIASALAQTYSSLTIVISDDCSTDDTFAVIERAVSGYSGPHRVIVRRNETNLAVRHVRDLLTRVETEFVVLGHGDDLFEPDRVTKQMERLIARDLSAVACNTTIIDLQGRPTRVQYDPATMPPVSLDLATRIGRNPVQLGAALAWRMELFREFPKPDPMPVEIDHVISFRALLKRGAEMMPEPLVRWRHHGANRSFGLQVQDARDEAAEMRAKEKRACGRLVQAHFMENDLAWWAGQFPRDRPAEIAKARQSLARRIQEESRNWAALRSDMAGAGVTPF
ncbi:MAG TPA: glycosyltransferase [Devosia sp.]|jgi:glycosyltransferase involved in cell wall biosynthesis|nr:glycosyltransferase [Devosia sp.]